MDHARSSDVIELLAEQSREHGVVTVVVTRDHDMFD